MNTYGPGRDDHYKRLARERLVVGDLFSYDVFGVTVKTGGRTYGSLSRKVAASGIVIPTLALNCAKFVANGPGKGHIFVALWSDESTYTPKAIYDCTRACIKQACVHGIAEIAMPLLGGNERAKFIGAMEQAVDHAEDEAADHDEAMPSVVFVTNRELL